MITALTIFIWTLISQKMRLDGIFDKILFTLFFLGTILLSVFEDFAIIHFLTH